MTTDAEQIRELCAIVGKPELADRFISRGRTPEQVRASLTSALKDDAREPISNKIWSKRNGKREPEQGAPADRIWARRNAIR